MANLFRAQWYRLFCRPSTAILLLVMAALAGLVAVQFTASWTDCRTFRAVLGRASVVEVCGPFVGLFLAAFFADDFQQGTVRGLMVGKGSRRAWGSAALVLAVLVAAGVLLMEAVVTGVAYGAMGGAPVALDGRELALWWLTATLLITAFTMLATLAAILVPANPSAAAIIAATLLTSGLGFWFCQAAALSLPSPVGAFVKQEVLPLSLTQIRLNLLNGLPIEPWWLADGALVIAAATAAIVVVMTRKELR